MADGEKSGSFVADIFKFLVILALVGGVVWLVWGEKIRARWAVRDARFSYRVDAAPRVADKLSDIVAGDYYWAAFFKHLPDEELDGEQAVIVIELRPGPKGKILDPGIRVDLEVRDETLGRTVYERRVKRMLPPGAFEGNGPLSEEETVVIYEDLAVFLRAAAVAAMGYRRELAEKYGPDLVKALSDQNLAVVGAAGKAFERLGPAALGQKAALEQLLQETPKDARRRREAVQNAFNAVSD